LVRHHTYIAQARIDTEPDRGHDVLPIHLVCRRSDDREAGTNAPIVPGIPNPHSAKRRPGFRANDYHIRGIALTAVVLLVEKALGRHDVVHEGAVVINVCEILVVNLFPRLDGAKTLELSIERIVPKARVHIEAIAVATEVKSQDREAFFLKFGSQFRPTFHADISADWMQQKRARPLGTFWAGVESAVDIHLVKSLKLDRFAIGRPTQQRHAHESQATQETAP